MKLGFQRSLDSLGGFHCASKSVDLQLRKKDVKTALEALNNSKTLTASSFTEPSEISPSSCLFALNRSECRKDSFGQNREERWNGNARLLLLDTIKNFIVTLLSVFFCCSLCGAFTQHQIALLNSEITILVARQAGLKTVSIHYSQVSPLPTQSKHGGKWTSDNLSTRTSSCNVHTHDFSVWLTQREELCWLLSELWWFGDARWTCLQRDCIFRLFWTEDWSFSLHWRMMSYCAFRRLQMVQITSYIENLSGTKDTSCVQKIAKNVFSLRNQWWLNCIALLSSGFAHCEPFAMHRAWQSLLFPEGSAICKFPPGNTIFS